MKKTQNYVAKHSKAVNVASVHKDKKQASKRGDTKHKGKDYE